jgi:hypothetical protein
MDPVQQGGQESSPQMSQGDEDASGEGQESSESPQISPGGEDPSGEGHDRSLRASTTTTNVGKHMTTTTNERKRKSVAGCKDGNVRGKKNATISQQSIQVLPGGGREHDILVSVEDHPDPHWQKKEWLKNIKGALSTASCIATACAGVHGAAHAGITIEDQRQARTTGNRQSVDPPSIMQTIAGLTHQINLQVSHALYDSLFILFLPSFLFPRSY